MNFSGIPIFVVDVGGSLLMIGLSFGCLRSVTRLIRRQPENLIWIYLFWVSVFLGGFAISRSVGHILKQLLLTTHHEAIWMALQPYSGSINTFMLIIVAAITLFFERVWQVYGLIVRERQALQSTHQELLSLNQNLERRVRERTEALARSEKQIAQADKLASIGQLSSGIAHEINNPLGIILGYTQLLMRQETEGSQKFEDLKIIEKHVKNCKSIVEDLLNFARSSKPKKEFMNIHEAIADVLVLNQHQTRLDGLIIEKDYDPTLPRLLMDEKKIKQVLINLLMNARHATGGRGTIRISTRHEPESGQVAIRIADSGCGIHKKNLSRIFDPFFTTKPTGEGTGLGLAVSYGIIKNHGGDILVSSEPGQGSEFTIVLPVAAKEENAA